MEIERIRELIDLMLEKDVAELQLEQHGTSICIRRPGASQPVVAAPVAAAPVVSAAAGPSPAETGDVAPEHHGAHTVRSPMVGTFYTAPEPGADAFVQVGDVVEEGQTLCIVEAMKLMNEITSDVAGEVVAVLAENSQPVEYGQELFAIRPS